MSTDLQVIEAAVPDALSTQAILAQVKLIQSVMKEVMIQDTHYGVIPGTGTKPTLLKAGAEKLLLTFRLDPQYESTEHFLGAGDPRFASMPGPPYHLTVRSKCTLYHQTSGRRMGSGEGSCSTMESKYAYRQGKRICPECGKDAIIKGREEYGGGWLCFKKKGGCGAKWPDGAQEIEGQSVERVPNEDVADQYNTVLKMANKRSLIAAVLNVTAASDIFTQDVEDLQTNPPIDAAAPRGGKPSQEAGLANEPVKSGGQAKGSVYEPTTEEMLEHIRKQEPLSNPAEPYIAKVCVAHDEKEARAAYEATPDELKQDVHQWYFDKLKELGMRKKK